MPDIDVTSAEYWRKRAREIRELAAAFSDAGTREILARLANSYEDLSNLMATEDLSNLMATAE